MNPFYVVGIAAKENRLPASVDAAYYASDAFYKRIRFEGKSGTEDQRQVLLHALRRIALDTKDSALMRSALAVGVVNLYFFGVSNPVPWLELPVGSPELAELTAAVEANLTGPLAKAVNRVRRRRDCWNRRSRQEDVVIDKFRNSLPWPDSAAYKANREAALAAAEPLYEILKSKRVQLRTRHQARVAALSRATMPGLSNWNDVVMDIALGALKPH